MLDKTNISKCKVEWCDNESKVKGYCKKHYKQVYRSGNVYKSRYDPNEYIIFEDYAELVIDNSNLGKCYVQIDLEDVKKCKQYKWFIDIRNENYYRICTHNSNNKPKLIKLHRYIFDIVDKSPKIEIDHIDGNTFNNRKSNLRMCSHNKNQKNLKIPSHNTSGTKGVWYNKECKIWVSEIICDGKKIHIGRSKDKSEAIKMRREKELELFKEYSRLNVKTNQLND